MGAKGIEKKEDSIYKEDQDKIPHHKTLEMNEKSQRKELIHQDLINQLEEQGLFSEYHKDLVKDYMFYYDLKEKMQRDVSKRGLVISSITGNGFKKKSVNENVKEMRETSKMMLKILQDLGLQEPKPVTDTYNPDDFT